MLYKRFCSYKFRNIHRKIPVLESILNKVAGLNTNLKNICERLLLKYSDQNVSHILMNFDFFSNLLIKPFNFDILKLEIHKLWMYKFLHRLLPSKHFLFFKTSWRRLQRNTFSLSRRRFQDVFTIRLPKMSSRRLQGVFARRIAIMSSRRLGRQKNVTLKTSWRRLQYVFTKTNICWVLVSGFLFPLDSFTNVPAMW